MVYYGLDNLTMLVYMHYKVLDGTLEFTLSIRLFRFIPRPSKFSAPYSFNYLTIHLNVWWLLKRKIYRSSSVSPNTFILPLFAFTSRNFIYHNSNGWPVCVELYLFKQNIPTANPYHNYVSYDWIMLASKSKNIQ